MGRRPFLLHALSPLHLGTGQAAGVIDLPVARMQASGIPIVPGSGIKGVLRDASLSRLPADTLLAIFGPETKDADKHAGALVVGDARLLALPVRSLRGTFAWTTSPLLLTLALRDLDGSWPAVPTLPAHEARVGTMKGPHASLNVFVEKAAPMIYLEDLDLPVKEDADFATWTARIADLVAPSAKEWFSRRFLLVDDETMTFLWETATQVDTRVRLNPETRTAQDAALWTEESLPPETLLIGLMESDRSRRGGVVLTADAILDEVLVPCDLQIGGKATVGRGRCRLLPATLPVPSKGTK